MKYPIGIQNFWEIRRLGLLYVDKTRVVFNAVKNGKYYFLSRPRRFGKSLLISTLEAYFKGQKDLFKGLGIAELEKEWIEYPVLRIDFSGKAYTSIGVLMSVLDDVMSEWEQKYCIERISSVPGLRLERILRAVKASTGKQTVILVDEYDKPIMDNLSNEALADQFRNELQGFYSVLKSMDENIRFGFLTGVTKIGKLSVFSGLNNLQDISMDPRYATICGICEDDLYGKLAGDVKSMASNIGMNVEECYNALATMYDGYHFCENSPGIYNPFSLLNALDAGQLKKYWFSTGTPAFLVKYLIQGNYRLDDVANITADEQLLSGVNTMHPDVISLLYQTGYLTIKDFDRSTGRYTLGYPNKEVEDGFVESLSEYFTPIRTNYSDLSVDKFIADILNGKADMLMRRFSAFFADMDYQIQGKAEMYFQNTMYVMLKLMGQQVDVERHTSNGRIDILIQTPDYVYIIELKRDMDPSNALDQISDKGYDWPFSAGGRKVFRIGATFSTATRRLEKWEVQ